MKTRSEVTATNNQVVETAELNGARRGARLRRGRSLRFVQASLGGLALMGMGAVTTVGCLDRPVSESSPNTSNLFVDQIRQDAVDKIDLLFMIDNSASMADKQKVLEQAVPDLVSRLVNPFCIGEGVAPVQPVDAEADCPAGTEREFSPIKDFHLGVITSSIGDAGANVNCPSGQIEVDDKAHLMGKARAGLPGADTGFLAWTGGDQAATQAIIQNFQSHVTGAGEAGCGYEASLEAWYRFLVDPAPPAALERVPCNANDAQNRCVKRSDAVDEALLTQRADFLRPDSLLAVIMLTDENDCSIQQGGQFWFAAASPNTFGYKATATCESNPYDNCCYSCAEGQRNGCPDKATECSGTGPAGGDHANLRCWEQKRRSGIDFLYPIERYVEGLKSAQITTGFNGCEAVKADNPIYTDIANRGGVVRDSSLVFFAGIVGVPWQDIAATDDTCNEADGTACPGDNGSLRYLTSSELTRFDRWKAILGTPEPIANEGSCQRDDYRVRHRFANPEDPFMQETPFARSGTNPFIDATLPADKANPNPLNGNDYNTEANGGVNGDLQYACTFPLNENPCLVGDCDCKNASDVGKPLCESQDVQTHAKAYPGTRLLAALNGFGDNSIVASICPKTMDEGAADYGYRPAVTAIIDRLKEALTGRCLPRTLTPNEEGLVQCRVIEAVPNSDNSVNCGRAGRAEVEGAVLTAVLNKLEENEICSKDPSADNACESRFKMCEIEQTEGAELNECQQAVDSPKATGWCYIDANLGIGNPELVANCGANERQLLRFVGAEATTPEKGATTFIACRGASLDDGVVVTAVD